MCYNLPRYADSLRPVSVSPADKPHNPMVNAGAIVCTSLIKVSCRYHLIENEANLCEKRPAGLLSSVYSQSAVKCVAVCVCKM